MPEEFDVFLSHNSRDKPVVEKIGAWLQAQGLQVWLDKWELRPGFPWQEGLEEGVRLSKAGAVFVGAGGLGDWQTPEMRAFLSRSRREQVPVIPVLLPSCPESPELALFLEAVTWVDLRQGVNEEGLGRLLWGITGERPERASRGLRSEVPGGRSHSEPYDVFISHASEDKSTAAMPLSDYLAERGLSVWLDEDQFNFGDGLRSAIDRGLRHARFGVVILSPAFVAKVWPRRELGAMFALEQCIDSKVILLVRHNLGIDELLESSPMQADRLSVSTSEGIVAVGDAVLGATRPRPGPLRPQASTAQQRREEIVSGLQRRLLAAPRVDDLRRVTVELEAHLSRYPQDVDARLLLDKARMVLWAELSRNKVPSRPTAGSGCLVGVLPSWVILIALVILTLIRYI